MGRKLAHIYLALLSCLMIFPSLYVKAQQETVYSQDIFSLQTINPAYAGVWNTTSFSALARKQWIGFDGSPSTQSLLMEYALEKKNVALGLSIMNDRIGLERNFGLFGDYSHRLDISKDVHIRLGLKFGFNSYSNNLNEYTTYDPNYDSDPAFQGTIEQFFVPNFGIGVFLYSEDFYVGMALPKLLQNELANDGNDYVSYAQMRHFYFHGGYIFKLSNDIKFKPTINTGIVIGAPVNIGLSANLLFKDQVWLGVLYRVKGSLGLSGQYKANKNLQIGYAVDFSTSDLSRYNYGTHEVIVSYEIPNKRASKKIRYY